MNNSQYALLALLSKGDMSGYDIKKLISKVSGYHWSESNAQIYPILEKLSGKGWVVSKIDEKSGARQKKVYSITSQGFDSLKEWVGQKVKPTKYKEELLVKISAAEFVDEDIVVSQLESYRDSCQEQLEELYNIQKDLNVRHSGKRLLYLQIVYDFSEKSLESKINWCKQSLKKIRHIH